MLLNCHCVCARCVRSFCVRLPRPRHTDAERGVGAAHCPFGDPWSDARCLDFAPPHDAIALQGRAEVEDSLSALYVSSRYRIDPVFGARLTCTSWRRPGILDWESGRMEKGALDTRNGAMTMTMGDPCARCDLDSGRGPGDAHAHAGGPGRIVRRASSGGRRRVRRAPGMCARSAATSRRLSVLALVGVLQLCHSDLPPARVDLLGSRARGRARFAAAAAVRPAMRFSSPRECTAGACASAWSRPCRCRR